MTPRTLFRYLFLLDRQAIQQIADCRQAVWLGLLFVISAGFAREYDGEDLLYEPWHLALPLFASFGTSILLFALLWSESFRWRWDKRSFTQSYRSFLGLYWMTAPLAWLYAFPVERFLSPTGSVSANLWLLAIVSVWRVVLMVRVTSVLFRMSAGQAIFPVMLFADTVALSLMAVAPLPVLSIMGGIRLTESEMMILNTAFVVLALGFLSGPIWLIGTFIVAMQMEGQRRPSSEEVPVASDVSISKGLWWIATVPILVWCAILPYTQSEQSLRYQAESLLRSGRIAEGVDLMTAHARSDFPRHWDPPPRIGYGERTPNLASIVAHIAQTENVSWVTDLYLDKFWGQLQEDHLARDFWTDMSHDDFDRYMTAFELLPETSPQLISQLRKLETSLGQADFRSKEDRDRLRALIARIAKEPTEVE